MADTFFGEARFAGWSGELGKAILAGELLDGLVNRRIWRAGAGR
ncbi:MAG TPA: hypothetical protein VM451_10075 [Candidatus Limnocylindria bacterium]|nr:hypothetical protein [Candidatus Limnocylindria bacterium]